MKKILLLMLGALLCLVPQAQAGFSVAVVVSSHLRPYTEALEGFRSAGTRELPAQGAKSIQPLAITEFTLEHQASEVELRRQISAMKPELLLAIGAPALSLLKEVRDLPVCYILVPEPQTITANMPNVTGITMEIPVERQLPAFVETFPRLKRLGLIYNPRLSDTLVAEISQAARGLAIELVTCQASEASAVPGLLAGMAGKIDGFWMLPDLTVTTPQTVEAMALFSLAERVPIFTFSEKYLNAGATVAVGLNNFALGEQAAALASEILARTGPAPLPAPVPPLGLKVRINSRVAEKIGITAN